MPTQTEDRLAKEEHFILLVYCISTYKIPDEINEEEIAQLRENALSTYYHDRRFHKLVNGLFTAACKAADQPFPWYQSPKTDVWKQAAEKWYREARDLERKLSVYREEPGKFRGGR